MLKIYESFNCKTQETIYYFIDKKTSFGFSVEMNIASDWNFLRNMSEFKKFDQSTLGYGYTTNSKSGKRVCAYFNNAVHRKTDHYKIDGMQVEALQSGAGWYAGCYDYRPNIGGAYCRISGYSDYKEFINHWIFKHMPEKEYPAGWNSESESED